MAYPPIDILSLETLILDGSTTTPGNTPSLSQFAHLLSHTPNIKTLWCKGWATPMYQLPIHYAEILKSCYDDCPDSQTPILLPHLSRLALSVAGYDLDLMYIMKSPMLRNLHLNGRSDEDYTQDSDAQRLEERMDTPGHEDHGIITLAQSAPVGVDWRSWAFLFCRKLGIGSLAATTWTVPCPWHFYKA